MGGTSLPTTPSAAMPLKFDLPVLKETQEELSSSVEMLEITESEHEKGELKLITTLLHSDNKEPYYIAIIF